MAENRFNRNELLFGKDGQARLRESKILVLGAGGLGSHVVAQIALLGVGKITVIDQEDVSQSNRNRYIGVWHGDPIPGSSKTELAERHVRLIDRDIGVASIKSDIVSAAALDEIKAADYVFGCVDNDGTRFFINEACLAHRKPLIDMASDATESGTFGGRVVIVTGNDGCLYCHNELDPRNVRRFLSTAEMRENEEAAYGIGAKALAEAGPSVVSVNGVVASLGVTAFMMLATEMGLPYAFQIYYGQRGIVRLRKQADSNQCYYCSSMVRGRGDQANLERYFRTLDSPARPASRASL